MDSITNDKLRQSIPYVAMPNLFVMTRGIADLPVTDQIKIMQKVKDFNTFNADNDPYGEHDFGSFEHNGKKIFWKIDDYNGQEGYNLVLTVMFAEEY